MSTVAVRRRPPLLPAALLVLVVVLGVVVVALTTGGDDDGVGGPAAACRALGGDLRDPSPSGAVCDVARTAYATESVRLRADGTLDPADRERRRRACRADAAEARRRALAAARTRTVSSYAAFRWSGPGVCVGTTTRLPAAQARAARADRLVEQAEALVDADPDAALRLARRADGLASSGASRAVLARAQAAARSLSGTGSATQLVSPSEYLGLGCAQIGHAFRVAPGSDPQHDPDGDGRACEGE